MLPVPAVPGWCLVSLHFLWGKLSTCTVLSFLGGSYQAYANMADWGKAGSAQIQFLSEALTFFCPSSLRTLPYLLQGVLSVSFKSPATPGIGGERAFTIVILHCPICRCNVLSAAAVAAVVRDRPPLFH